MTPATPKTRKMPKKKCNELVADPKRRCPVARDCSMVECPEAKASRLMLLMEMSDVIGPSVWTTMDFTNSRVPDALIKTLFVLLSVGSFDESRIVVFDPARLMILEDAPISLSDRIHVGVDMLAHVGEEDASRVEALKKVPLAVKFIRCQDMGRDLVDIDLTGIDYVTDGTNHRRVKDGVVQ